MQFAKDSFYVALRDRLAALNPARVVYLDGASRPAVIVAENQAPGSAVPFDNASYLRWGAARMIASTQHTRRPLLALDCVISYRTSGTADNSFTDRGRTLAALDLELLSITSPGVTAKQDFSQAPALDLGTKILWRRPQLGDVEVLGSELRRSAALTIFFFPEVDLP
jgi:hypothetical protein